jgi:hypothetical protein
MICLARFSLLIQFLAHSAQEFPASNLGFITNSKHSPRQRSIDLTWIIVANMNPHPGLIIHEVMIDFPIPEREYIKKPK